MHHTAGVPEWGSLHTFHDIYWTYLRLQNICPSKPENSRWQVLKVKIQRADVQCKNPDDKLFSWFETLCLSVKKKKKASLKFFCKRSFSEDRLLSSYLHCRVVEGLGVDWAGVGAISWQKNIANFLGLLGFTARKTLCYVSRVWVWLEVVMVGVGCNFLQPEWSCRMDHQRDRCISP